MLFQSAVQNQKINKTTNPQNNNQRIMARFHQGVRVSTVRYGSGPNTLIQLAFPPPTVPLLDRRGVCM